MPLSTSLCNQIEGLSTTASSLYGNIKLQPNKLAQEVPSLNLSSQDKIYKLKLSVDFLGTVHIFTECQNWDRSEKQLVMGSMIGLYIPTEASLLSCYDIQISSLNHPPTQWELEKPQPEAGG
jgi:hypothetical protein